MADIALVSLGIDSSGVVAGEKQATRALHQVDAAMQRTEKQAQQLNTGLNANIKKSGDAFKGLSDSASRAGATLQGLGGPIGRAAGEITNLGGQLDDLVGSFGLMGGAAIGAVAGVAALGGALLKMALDGIKLSDNLGDLGQSLGFSADQMEKLNAASRLAGEDVGTVERAFSTFQGTIKSAIADPSSEAAKSLRVLGVNAKTASRDTQGAFLDMLGSLSSVTDNFDQLTAARDVFGRGTHSLIRTSEEFTRVMRLTNEQMANFGFAATEAGRKGAAEADRAINEVSLKFETFKRNLASDWGPAIARTLEIINAGLEQMRRGGGFALGAISNIVDKPTHPQLAGLFNIGKAQPGGGGLGGQITPPPGKPAAARPVELAATLADLNEANRATKAFFDAWRAVTESFYSAQLTDFNTFTSEMTRIDAGMREAQVENARQVEAALVAQLAKLKPGTENFKRVSEQLDKVRESMAKLGEELNITVLPNIEKFLDRLKPLFTLGAAPPIAATRPRTVTGIGVPHPDDISVLIGATRPRRVKGERKPEAEQLDAAFAAIFDDMLISILTAQKTLGGAFAGLALGIVDTFAVEFTKELRKSLITPVIQGLTDMLQSSLQDLFGGLSAKGLKGVFGGIVKGIGSIFGGFFQAGGTLGANKFGVVGERGAELIYSGASPLHVAPMATNTSGMNFTLVQNIHAPDGSVSRRTQDQMADSVLKAVERANRNRGAR